MVGVTVGLRVLRFKILGVRKEVGSGGNWQRRQRIVWKGLRKGGRESKRKRVVVVAVTLARASGAGHGQPGE